MHIAMIDPSLFTPPYDLKLVGGLERLGHRVDFYGKPVPPDETMAGDTVIRPLFYREMGRWRLDRLPGPFAKLAKGVCHLRGMNRLVEELRRTRPEIIHFQWLPLPVIDQRFLEPLRAVAPLVVTAHDSQPFNANPGAAIQRLGAISILNRFDRVIVHTANAQDRLVAQGVPPERIQRIAHGFLNDDQPPSPPPDIRPDRPVRFVLFGKVKPYKGTDLLIEAVRRLPEGERARCEVLVIGKPYMDTRPLTDAAASLGDRIRFDFRFVPDAELIQVLNDADVLVFPYREIEMSGVLMAALRTTRPIIASAIGGFAELLQDGRSALLVPPGDVDALSKAIGRVIREPETRRALADGVARQVADVPSWDEIARRTTALYEQCRDRSMPAFCGAASKVAIAPAAKS